MRRGDERIAMRLRFAAQMTTGRFRGRAAMTWMRRGDERIAMRLRFAAQMTTGRFRGRAAMAWMRRGDERTAMRLRFCRPKTTTGRFCGPSFISIKGSRPTVGSTD